MTPNCFLVVKIIYWNEILHSLGILKDMFYSATFKENFVAYFRFINKFSNESEKVMPKILFHISKIVKTMFFGCLRHRVSDTNTWNTTPSTKRNWAENRSKTCLLRQNIKITRMLINSERAMWYIEQNLICQKHHT